MKIAFLLNNVPYPDAVQKGIDIARAYLKTIESDFSFSIATTSKQFTGIPNNYTDSMGMNIHAVCIPNDELKDAFSGIEADTFCLVYDWDKVNPKPTNPSDLGAFIQIPMQWYGYPTTYPEVFAEYLLHELCHQYFAALRRPDLTHNKYAPGNEQFYQKTNVDYYLFLLQQLLQKPVRVLKLGLIGEDVRALQKDLDLMGYFHGIATGIFGTVTQLAVKGFQIVYNLKADGIAGPVTLKKIADVKKKL